MAADIAKRRLGPKQETGPRERDELDRLLDDMKGAGQVVVKEVVREVHGIPMVLTAEYEVERRVREQCIRDVAIWIGWTYSALPANPELAWDVLRDAVEAGPKELEELEEKLVQLERARDMVSELQEGLTDEFAGTGMEEDGLILKELVDSLSPAIDPETGGGVTQEEIDKLKKLTAALIKLAEGIYDALREE